MGMNVTLCELRLKRFYTHTHTHTQTVFTGTPRTKRWILKIETKHKEYWTPKYQTSELQKFDY